MLFSENPKMLSEFYAKVFGKEPDMDDGEYSGIMAGGIFLGFGPHDKVKGKSKVPERIMINFETEDVKEEFERIKELGAKVIAEPYQMEGSEAWIATLADPDGNFFQLMSPWKGEELTAN
jgi:predicted enzyme related to lactoylglutathione lyase